jgi:dipeptidyl-peptidase-4
MKRVLFPFAVLFIVTNLLFASPDERNDLLTVPEKTDFKKTSRYSDVIDFIYQLKEKSELVNITFFATSYEGRKIPLVILSRQGITDPVTALSMGKKPVLIVANIHAGEVCAKEASLMLMRDIASGDLSYLLDKLVVLVVPILNPDGNEMISKENRRIQPGPEEGVGKRVNARNMDLNRDFTKLDSKEIRGLISKLITRWRPLLTINGHTSNGSPHRYDLSYAPPLNPNTYPGIFNYQAKKMLPAISSDLEEQYGFKTFFYGNFRNWYQPDDGWYIYSHLPRFDTNYVGMYNLMAILTETCAYIPYKRRIEATRRFDEIALKFVYAHLEEIEGIEREALTKTIEWGNKPAQSPNIAIGAKIALFDKSVTIKGWKIEEHVDEKTGKKAYTVTNVPKDYRIPFYGRFIPTIEVKRPYAYLLLPGEEDILAKLIIHGLRVERLVKPVDLEVEGYLVDKVEGWERIYEGHRSTKVSVKATKLRKNFPEGTYVIPMAQEGANLVSYLLEPESDDGFLFWNLFDHELIREFSGKPIGEFPIYRLVLPVFLPSSVIKD